MDAAQPLPDNVETLFPEEPTSTLPNGSVENRDENGALIQRTTYVNGVLEGECVCFNAQGVITQKLFYHQGKLQGECLTCNDEGKLIQRLSYDQGKLHGMIQMFDKEVLLAEIPYKNGVREGVARFLAPNGRLQAEITFSNDKENGLRTIYDSTNGTVLRKEILVDGGVEGESLTFFPNGDIMLKQSFKGGLLEGESTQFYEDGTVQQHAKYEKGILTEPVQKFDQKGKEI